MSNKLNPIEKLEKQLSYTFKDQSLAWQAVTHASWSAEYDGDFNERLEFLGDSVLALVVSEDLFNRFREADEGLLTRYRSHLVSSDALFTVADQLQLGSLLRLGKGEEQTGGRTKRSNLVNALEACLGAVYLDGGLNSVKAVIDRLIWVSATKTLDDKNYKGKLQEWCQKNKKILPIYQHQKTKAGDYEVSVYVNKELSGQAQARTKKEAQQKAAHHVLVKLKIISAKS